MNKLTRIAIVAAGAVLAVQSAFASANDDDLIFSVNNNDGGGSTEFNINLGLESSFSGPNYNLSSLLTGYSSFASAGASGLNVGVAGGRNAGGLTLTGSDVYTTTMRVGNSGQYSVAGTESVPNSGGSLPTKNNISAAGNIVGTFADYGNNVSTGPGSFTSGIAYDPTTPGTVGANNFSTDLGLANATPLQSMTGSTITLDLWRDVVTSSTTTSGWVYQGTLTFDLSGAQPSLVWDAAPVPEPSVYALCGIGLMALTYRQFRRKNA